MQVNHKVYKQYFRIKYEKSKYDDYSDEDDYYQKSKIKLYKEKDKKYKNNKTIDSFYGENNTKNLCNTTRQKSIWGSTAYNNNKNYYKNKNYTEKYSNNSYLLKKENKKMKIIKSILKCLIEFKKSRREVKAKYFDIWYDETFYYDTKCKYDNKYIDSFNSNKKNYENKIIKKYNKYDSFKINDNNKVQKSNYTTRRKSDKNEDYYAYSRINNKDNYYFTFNDIKYESLGSDYNNNNTKNNNFYSKPKKNNKKRISDDYYKSPYNTECGYRKLCRIKKNKSKGKIIFNERLLYILNKYLIEKKEKSQCFNKWLDYVDSLYFYNDKKELDYKENKLNYNNKYLDKYKNKYQIKKDNDKIELSSYKVEKYYKDYEDTPKRNDMDGIDDQEDDLYNNNEKDDYNIDKIDKFNYKNYLKISNNKKNRNEQNDIFKIKYKTMEVPKKIQTYSTYKYNNESEVNTNKCNEYDTTTVTKNPNDTEKKLIYTKTNKPKSFDLVDDKIIKEAKSNIFKHEEKIIKNFPEKTRIFHKKEIKIDLLPDNIKNKRLRTKHLSKEEKYIDFGEFISPSNDNNNFENNLFNKDINKNNNFKINNDNNQKLYININNNYNNKSQNYKIIYNINEEKEKEKQKEKEKEKEEKKKLLINLLNKYKSPNINLINSFKRWINLIVDYNYSENTDKDKYNKHINENNHYINNKDNSKKTDNNDNDNENENEDNKIVNIKKDTENDSEIPDNKNSNTVEDENYLYIRKKHKKTKKENQNTEHINKNKEIKEKDYFITDFKEPSLSDSIQQSLNNGKKKDLSLKNSSSINNKLSSTSENLNDNDNNIKIEIGD